MTGFTGAATGAASGEDKRGTRQSKKRRQDHAPADSVTECDAETIIVSRARRSNVHTDVRVKIHETEGLSTERTSKEEHPAHYASTSAARDTVKRAVCQNTHGGSKSRSVKKPRIAYTVDIEENGPAMARRRGKDRLESCVHTEVVE
jgi:hypothetical protein